MGIVLMVSLVGVFVLGINQFVFAEEKKPLSVTEYCSKYPEGSNQRFACRDGVRGERCEIYQQLFGDIEESSCKQAAQDRAKGIVIADPLPKETAPKETDKSGASGTPLPTKSSDTNTALQERLDNIEKNVQKSTEVLNKAIDLLAKLSPKESEKNCDDKTSNSKSHYINGSCAEQQIRELNPGKGNSPVILFFNGGAWISNDCVSDRVAGKDFPDCPNFYGNQPPVPPAITDRYAMYNVTYRLGTSGIYYQLEDVLRGIKHFKENASLYGIDPGKIVIWGDSAGGSLVVRAAATGISGAKATVGWAVATNAYTAIFKSIQTFAVGIIHTTCVPKDPAGIANVVDLANGGDGKVAQYDGGFLNFDFSSLGINGTSFNGTLDPTAALTELVQSAGVLAKTVSSAENISNQIKSKNYSALFGSAINIGTKKFVECVDNFNAMSPALFASPDTPPTFIADFDNDGLVGPEQAYGMRDKLQQLGIKSEALIRPGDPDCVNVAAAPAGAGGCHLGYYWAFVCPSIRFIDSVVQPDNQVDCETGSVP